MIYLTSNTIIISQLNSLKLFFVYVTIIKLHQTNPLYTVSHGIYWGRNFYSNPLNTADVGRESFRMFSFPVTFTVDPKSPNNQNSCCINKIVGQTNTSL